MEIEVGNDCMAYTEQDNDGEILPLLNIFKPIRSKSTHWPAQFLALAKDGSYLFEVGGDFRHPLRLFPEDVDKEFENVPDIEPYRVASLDLSKPVCGSRTKM